MDEDLINQNKVKLEVQVEWFSKIVKETEKAKNNLIIPSSLA